MLVTASAASSRSEPESYDVVILGTDLTQCILAAALSRAGLTVLQLDACPYYGRLFSAASLSVRDLALSSHRSLFDAFDVEGPLSSLCLAWPEGQKCFIDFTALPFCARDPMIAMLIDSGTAAYVDFKLVSHFFLYSPSYGFFKVPLSKEDIFLHEQLSLVEKRKLMKMLQSIERDQVPDMPLAEWIASFHMPAFVHDMFCYGLAKYVHASEAHRAMAKDLRGRSILVLSSLGVYGASPFLLPNYGASELPQGFSRRSSVMGGSVMLGHAVQSLVCTVSGEDNKVHYQIETDRGMAFLARTLVGDAALLARLLETAGLDVAQETVHRLILVTRAALCCAMQGLAYMVVAPSALTRHCTVHVLQTSAEVYACPPGHYVLHFYTLDAASEHTCQELLGPLADSFFPHDREKDAAEQSVLFRLYTSKRVASAKHLGRDDSSGNDHVKEHVFVCPERLEPTMDGASCFQKCIQDAQEIYCKVLNLPKSEALLFPLCREQDHGLPS